MSELIEPKIEPADEDLSYEPDLSYAQNGFRLQNEIEFKLPNGPTFGNPNEHYDVTPGNPTEHYDVKPGNPTENFCQICEINFPSEIELASHHQSVHQKLRPFVCELCFSAHTTRQKLKEHITTIHEKKKPYECDQCDRKFGRSQGLAKHKQYVHNKERPFTCPLCEKAVARKSDLNTHIRLVHEQLKPHECSYCGKTFGTSSNLGIHIKHMHERNANVACPGCDKMFLSTGKQRQHYKQVHEKFRGFICEFCNKGFAAGKDKRRHILAVHEKRKNFQCLSCEKGYATYSDLKIHEQVAHGGEQPLPLLLDSDVAHEPLDVVEVSMNSDEEMDEQDGSDDHYHVDDDEEVDDDDISEESKKKLFPPLDHYIHQLKAHKIGGSYSGSNNSHFEHPTYPRNTSKQNLARARNLQTLKIKSEITQADCPSNILEIYCSNNSIDPITHSEWIQIEKFLICQLTTEITSGAISALQVKISKSDYDSDKMCGMIQLKDAESRNWYQTKVAKFRLDDKSFRAWTREEMGLDAIPEVFQIGLVLPTRLSSVDESAVMKLLVSFNPQLDQFQHTLKDVQFSETEGRTFILEVCKDFFEFISERDWKLDFLMGEVICANLSQNL